MISEQIIEYQRQLIYKNFIPLITSDYVLLDLPYHSNIGDSLIWKGEEQLLSTFQYRCLYRCSFKTFEYRIFPEDTIILMQGGGNFGDLYPLHNEFRRRVIELYPNNRIIILPQTVYYESARQARFEASCFRQHKHLTIFARDNYSYRFLKAFRFSEDVRLMPDMAFCIDTEWLKSMSKPNNGRNLYFKRIDKEANESNNTEQILKSNEYDYGDWPDYGQPEPMLQHLNALIGEQKFAEADEYAINTYLPARIRIGVEFISQYNKIVSNRLHGAILSILLGKDVVIVDNSYGKNSQYYNTWLKNIDSISILSSPHRIRVVRIIRFLFHWIISYI